MRFIVDAQLPPALARWLTTQGVEAEHVFDVRFHEASDAAICAMGDGPSRGCHEQGPRFRSSRPDGRDGAQGHLGRVRQRSRVELLRRFTDAWPVIVEALGRGETLIELL